MFTIAWKDMKIRLKDRKSFITLLLMPIVLTMILGSALSGVFGEDRTLPETSAGIVVSSTDEVTDQFIQEVLQGKELRDSITVSEFKTEEGLREALDNQKIDAGLILPVNWGEGLMMGEEKTVTILKDPAKEIQATILSSITESFVDRITTVSVAAGTVAEMLSAVVPVSNQDVNSADLITSLVDDLSVIAGSKVNAVVSEKDGKEPISGMQYYAAAMGAMFILFNTTIGAKTIIQERKTDTLARLMCTPIRHSSIMIGKFLGTFSFSLLQFIVFVITTHYLFGVAWGNNILQLLVVGIAYSVAVAGISMIIAGLITEEKTADTMGGIGVQILALLGGSMIPLASFPNMMQQMANIAPNKWAFNSFLEIMNGASWSSLVMSITILMAIGLTTLFIGSMKLKYR
ncbi:ABC transporter permease [Metabacillus endolithicus]|uniref:ABC transporter permease n=1 Tax=Metabacillus endolithicus TaxID=1535204 RepID=UPI001FF8964B|nr:ABC transporter permease [Metabacillus endolithicus]UPG65217.1 ABC transporter permease [Metabacillus endolithicus]